MKVVNDFFVTYSNTFPETKSSPQKNHGWKMIFSFWGTAYCLFLVVLAVSFRKGTNHIPLGVILEAAVSTKQSPLMA